MKNYWIITERGANVDSFPVSEFNFTGHFYTTPTAMIHIYLPKKRIFA